MRRAELPPANFRPYRIVESLAEPQVKALKLSSTATLAYQALLTGPTSVLTVRPVTS